ncbi:MAG: hypothetical protein CMF28_01455 [Kiritimatiellaceae bacterium]|jgi:plasmid maintenance system antidote protein VapI|nr:hypothetical protein [Kiritimatiellaceae bacterium]RZO85328.1 MAG: hypothetical protein EVA58_04940 [Kiritimatiellaceae bacterium]|tara:strand:- start:714 stop:968 length:255 start_codon:yes stop_codon:yes gene_type:complete
MLTCKQVSKALAENRYYELSWRKRVALFTHIRLCKVCGKANQFIVDLQTGVQKYLKREEEEHFTEVTLTDEERQRIREKITSSK